MGVRSTVLARFACRGGRGVNPVHVPNPSDRLVWMYDSYSHGVQCATYVLTTQLLYMEICGNAVSLAAVAL